MLNQMKITALLVVLMITKTFAVQNTESVSPAQRAKNRHILHSLQRAHSSDFMMKERQTIVRNVTTPATVP